MKVGPWSGLHQCDAGPSADRPAMVQGDLLKMWTAGHGYGPTVPRPNTGFADVITPPSIVDALINGYQPMTAQSNFDDPAPQPIPATANVPLQTAVPRSAPAAPKGSTSIRCEFRLANGEPFAKKINRWTDESTAQRGIDLYLGQDRQPLNLNGRTNLASPLDQPEVRLIRAQFV